LYLPFLFMKRIIITLISLAFFNIGNCQTIDKNKINIGTEQDFLPYATGGYYGSVWAGKSHLRFRALTARVKKPDVMVPDGFTNNWVTAYAVLGDYFRKENWKGWSISCGFVYWKNSIELSTGSDTENYDTYLLNGSLAYTFTVYRHFYIAPWAGLHLKVGGADEVNIDQQSFTTPLINPEASVKIGIYL
jgi:hypothetical protein